MNNLPKVVTQRCLEQDLNPRPTDRKPKCVISSRKRPVTDATKRRVRLCRRIRDDVVVDCRR